MVEDRETMICIYTCFALVGRSSLTSHTGEVAGKQAVEAAEAAVKVLEEKGYWRDSSKAPAPVVDIAKGVANGKASNQVQGARPSEGLGGPPPKA